MLLFAVSNQRNYLLEKKKLLNLNHTNDFTDNIDTRTALDHIRDLVTQCNIYLKQSSNPDTQILRDIAEYVTNLMYTFGIKTDSIGFLVETEVGSINVTLKINSASPILNIEFSYYRQQNQYSSFNSFLD